MKYRKNAISLLKLTFHLSKKFYLLCFISAIVLTGSTFIGVYGLSVIIESLINGDITYSFRVAIIILSVEVILRFLDLTLETNITLERDRLKRKVKVYLANQLMQSEFRYIEDPSYLDTADKARFAIDNFSALNGFLFNVIFAIQNLVTMCSLITIIVLLNPIILSVLFVSVIIFLIISKFSAKEQIELYNKLGPNNRRFGYFLSTVTDARYQKDFYMYPLRAMMYRKLNQFLDDTCDYINHFYRVIGKYQVFYKILSSIQITFIYLLIAYTSITANLGVSHYIFLTAAAIKASSAINQFVSRFVRVRENIQLLQPLVDIMDMEQTTTTSEGKIHCEPLKSLRFDHVYFSYPNQNKRTLHDVTFEIHSSDKISIVGMNGAGKTTIIKLICRFYQPDQGTIYWNDLPINHYDYKSYIHEVSAVFQDFKLFALTLSENVDLKEERQEDIRNALYRVGLKEKINQLPNRVHSFLSKEYSETGIELSGGQQQKIAIARAMYKQSSLAILDEPTSALDPLVEAEIYENFNDLIQDRTTIFISHRMSSSQFCNKIIVLDKGEIQHIDTHENLMKLTDGLYYRLFQSQSSYYQ